MSSVRKLAKNNATMEDLPPLDRYRADEILEPNGPIWGLAQIAGRLGLSVDTVRELASREDTPIYRPSGKYFAWSAELDAWLRSK
ncbi:DNA-binding protein [Xinfangfangia sp. D13-10-4-6]|nr:DNA-binding protein [Pseudogemmobacter hezensis]